MADIQLVKPAQGQQVVMQPAENARLVMDFPANAAQMTRTGDNLVFTFEDGSSIVVENFYTAYSKETLPDFQVEGADISGADFFTAMNSDLMPAAGPGAGAGAAAGGARYHSWASNALYDGIDRLGGLDLASNREPEIENRLYGFPGGDDAALNLDATAPALDPFAPLPPVVDILPPVTEPGTPDLDPVPPVTDPDTPDVSPNVPPTISISGTVTLVEAGVKVGGNDLKEGVPEAGGQVVAGDEDGDTLSYAFVGPNGELTTTLVTQYGTITIGADGSYTYTLNNASANGLAEGAQQQESFTVQVSDGRGGIATGNVTVDITGTNDVPTLDLDKASLLVTDDGTVEGSIADSGNAHGDDVDAGHQLHYSFGTAGDGSPITSVTDQYGTLTINPDTGAYTYVLDKNSPDVRALGGQGDDVTQRVNVVVTDEHGAHAERPLDITIKGANDSPEITTPGGDLNLKEAGVGDKTQTGINDGWAEGENQAKINGTSSAESSFTVTDADRDTLTTTLLDGNGNPVAGVVTDPDTGVMTLTTAYGTLTVTPNVNADGSVTYTYKYDLDNDAANSLKQGESHDLDYKIAVSDGKSDSVSQDVHVRIEGTNDAPDVTVSKVHVREEGVAPGGNTATTDDGRDDGYVFPVNHREVVEGTLPSSDPDNDAELTFGINVGGKEGGISADGITVNLYTGSGSDAKPVLDDKGNPVTENLVLSSDQTSIDPSTGNTIQTLVTNYGTLILDTVTGKYSFELNAEAANHLGQGEKFDFHFTTTVTDEHGAQAHHQLGVTVEGTNDRPALSINEESKTLEVFEKSPNADASYSNIDEGKAMGTDVDHGAQLRYSFGSDDAGNPITSIPDQYGTMHIDPQTGRYWYELNNDSEATLGLGEGERVDPSGGKGYTIRVTDEHGAFSDETIQVVIQGTNATPEITSTEATLKFREQGFEAKEPGEFSQPNVAVGNTNKVLSGDVGAHDADPGDKLTFFFTKPYEKGDLLGTLTLAGAEAQDITVTSVSADGLTINTNYGSFHLDSSTGHYTFTPSAEGTGNSALNVLQNGDKVELSFEIGVKDQNGAEAEQTHTVKVDIDGSNDLASANNGSITLREEGVFRNGNLGGNQVTKEDTDNNPGVGEFKTESGQLHLTGLKDVDDDVNAGFGTVEGTNFVLKLTGGAAQHHTVPQGQEDGSWTSESLLSSSGDMVQVWNTIHRADFPPEQLKALLNVLGKDSLAQLTQNDLSGISMGTLTLHADGSYDFTWPEPGTAGYIVLNTLDENYGSSRTFGYSITDPHGGIGSSGNIQVIIRGSNDRPTLELTANDHITVDTTVDDASGFKSTEATLTMTEDDVAVSGKANGYDADFNHQLTYAVAKGEIGDASSTDVTDLTQAFNNKYGTDGMGNAHTTANGDYGTLKIAADGSYTYTPKENLAYGHEYEETFTVFVRDEKGAWSQQHLNVKVTGSADAPVIKGEIPTAMVAEVTESGVRFNTNTDVDASATGKGTVDLGNGEFKLGSFEVTQTDSQAGHGELTPGFITADGVFHQGSLETPYGTLYVEMQGNKAVYSFVMPEEGSEAAARLNALTPDERIKLFDDLRVGIYDSAHKDLVGANGGSIDENGHFSFNIDSGNAGLVPSQAVDVYIHGTNDRPFFTTGETGQDGLFHIGDVPTVSEDGGTASGTLAAKDYDNADASLRFSILNGQGGQVQVLQGKYGILTLDESTGAYTYTLTADPGAYQHLNPQQLLELEGFTVRVSDPLHAYTDAKLTFQVQGEKDDAHLAGSDLSVSEDAGQAGIVDVTTPKSGEGTLNLKLTDDQNSTETTHTFDNWTVNGQTITANGSEQTVESADGNLVLRYEGGQWKYHYELTQNADAAVQNMAEGESRTHSFEVEVKNNNGETVKETITITINGTNDKPTIDSYTSHGAVKAGIYENLDQTTDTENPGVVFTGTVKGSDTDHALDANGNAIEGKTESLTYLFVVRDAAGNIIGTTSVVKTEHGSFTIDPATGEYRYTLDDMNVDHAGLAGLQEKVEVVAVDIHGAQSDPKEIVIDLNNADSAGEGPGQDVVFKEGTLQGTVIEDGGTTPSSNPDSPSEIFNGQLDAAHGDGTDAADHVFGLQDGNSQVQTMVKGDYGYLTINPATGEYTYTLFNGQNGVAGSVQSLGEGASLTENFVLMLNGQVVMQDGKPVTIDITIKGTNDAPEITGITSDQGNSIAEGVQDNNGVWSGTVTGTVNAKDVDLIAQPDGTRAQEELTFSVEGGTLGEDGMVHLVVDGKGELILDPQSGAYTFKVDPNHAHLTLGQTDTANFKLIVSDQNGGSDSENMTITLKGVNLAPEAVEGSHSDALHVVEDGSLSATSGVLDGLVFKDDEGAGNLTYSLTEGGAKVSMVTGTYGTLQFNADGTYTYVLNNQNEAVQGLRGDQTETEIFKVTVWDKHGESKEVEIKVNVQGTNDAPVATVDHVLVVREGQTDDVSAKIDAHDSDLMADGSSESLTFAFDAKFVADHNGKADSAHQWALNADGTLRTEYGTYSLDANGKVTFTLDNDSSSVIGLGAGQLAEQQVSVSVSDGHEGGTSTQKVTVSIEGTNSAPEVTAITNNSENPLVENGKSTTFNGQVTGIDPDAGDKVTNYMFLVDGKLVSNVTGEYGAITINSDGTYLYTMNNGSESLAQGETGKDSFKVVAVDSYGKQSEAQDVDIFLKGTNDKPVIDSVTSSQDNTGSLTFHDVDVRDTHSLYVVIGAKSYAVQPDGTCAIDGVGTFTLTGENGAWNYTFDADITAAAGIAQGESQEIKFRFWVEDSSEGNNTTVTNPLQVTIHGTNSAPVGEDANHDLQIGVSDAVHALGNIESSVSDAEGDNPLSIDFAGANAAGVVEGDFGTLHFNAQTGEYGYALTTDSDKLLDMARHNANGEDITDSFTYRVTDSVDQNHGSEATVDVHLHGTVSESGVIGDLNASDDQFLFAGIGVDTLYGGHGNDIMSGGTGDNTLYGGDGNDTLFGGWGNDSLDGGNGVNELYGGTGNDILVYNQGNSVMDGGEGIDFLLGVERADLEELLGKDSPLESTELIVLNGPGGALGSLTDMKDLGIMVSDDSKVTFDSGAGWAATEATHVDASGMEYVEMHNSETDLTVLVQQHILNHQG